MIFPFDDIKDYWNNQPICLLYSQTGNQGQQVNQMSFILLGTVSANTLSNMTIRISFLVGEESCIDNKNTPYICSAAFYDLAVLLMDEYGVP